MSSSTFASAPAALSDEVLRSLNRDQPSTARVEKTGEYADGAVRVERFRLGNGLVVLTWEDHRAPVFSYQTWFRVGSRHEREGRTGIAHLFEHLMFKATANYPEGEFDRLMEARGAQTNAATFLDWTHYVEKLPSGHLDLVCELEADRMENLRLDEEQLESEREVVINERLLRVDNDPDGQLDELLFATAFEVHPYRWPTIGWMEDIRAITLEDCQEFYRRFYAPDNASVVVVGDVDTAETLRTIQHYYGHLEPGGAPSVSLPAEPPQQEERRRELQLPVRVERGQWAWHAMSAADPDHAALEVLDEVLTGGESSRLYRRLVTDEELASQVGGGVPGLHDPGVYEMGMIMRPGVSVDEGERVMDEVLDELVATPPSERELEKARNGVESDFLREMADTGHRARGLGDSETTVESFRWLFDELDALRRVTPDDVQRVARRVLRRTNRTAVLGRPDPAAGEAS